MEISETGNLDLLGVGEVYEKEVRWEEILVEAFKASGSLDYESKLDEYRKLVKLMTDLMYVKAALTKLYFKVDDELIEDLGSMGYKIDKSGAMAYLDSLNNCFQSSNNIASKLQSLKAKMSFDISPEEGAEKVSFEEILVNLSAAIGYPVGRDLLLCEYNQYRKLLAKKNKNKLQHG